MGVVLALKLKGTQQKLHSHEQRRSQSWMYRLKGILLLYLSNSAVLENKIK
jgi:hypothetical protein